MANYAKYGTLWTSDDLFQIEMEAIRRGGHWKNSKGQNCGLGLPAHIKNFQSIVWPWKQWTRWNEDLILPEMCASMKGGRLALFGPSSTWKTFECACFALTMFWIRPKGTTILCSTTTIDALNTRIFGEIKDLFRQGKERYPLFAGHLLDSDQMILADPKGNVGGRDFRDGILGVPCKKGNEWQSLSEYVGLKNDVVIMIADECHLMQMGFWNGMANLLSNDQAMVMAVGNLNDPMSPLGKAAEPQLGWDSLPDTDKSRVYKTRWYNGRAIQLIGKDSPNLDFPPGQEPFKKLIGRRYIEQCAHDYGEDTVLYNMFASGKIPRGSMMRRVITRQLAIKNMAMEPIDWGSDPIVKLYAMDAAYSSIGGDRTAGAPWAFGKDFRGEWKFAMLDKIKIYVGSPDNKQSHEDFLALQAKEECQKYGIEPHHFFFDGTGRASLMSSLAKLWSSSVIAVEFGGRASLRPNFQGLKYAEDNQHHNKGDIKPCNELFNKFVSELWFATAAAIASGQIRGITEDMVEEGSLRMWKELPGGKIDVEPKRGTSGNPGMIERTGRSPDLYDMFVTALEGARRLGFPLGKLDPTAQKKASRWAQKMRSDHLKKMREGDLKYAA